MRNEQRQPHLALLFVCSSTATLFLFVLRRRLTLVSTKTYTVQSGDNLTKIAKQFNTTVDSLVSKNGIKDKNKIYVGQVLKI